MSDLRAIKSILELLKGKLVNTKMNTYMTLKIYQLLLSQTGQNTHNHMTKL